MEIIKREQAIQIISDDEVALIKSMICSDLTNQELQLFIWQAKKAGLHPLAKQIHAVKRYDSRTNTSKMSIQTSVDGYRLIAERTGNYAGQTPVEFCGDDGIWTDAWTKKEHPLIARVGVYRKDNQLPIFAAARWNEYCPSNDKMMFMWNKMPTLMLGKCAETLALRKAFPQELSGILTNEEMEQSIEQAEAEITIEVKEAIQNRDNVKQLMNKNKVEAKKPEPEAIPAPVYKPQPEPKAQAKTIQNKIALAKIGTFKNVPKPELPPPVKEREQLSPESIKKKLNKTIDRTLVDEPDEFNFGVFKACLYSANYKEDEQDLIIKYLWNKSIDELNIGEVIATLLWFSGKKDKDGTWYVDNVIGKECLAIVEEQRKVEPIEIERPYPPEVLKQALQVFCTENEDDGSPITPETIKFVRAGLNQAIPLKDLKEKEQCRHFITEYLFGITKTEQLSEIQGNAINVWIGLEKIANEWTVPQDVTDEVTELIGLKTKMELDKL